MKLHLPKALFTAVIAAFAVGGVTASAMTATTTYTDVTIDTSSTYDGVLFDYADETLTLNGSPNSLALTFTLDYDAFAALTATTDLLYVNTTGNIWGFRATANDTVTGRYKAGDWGGTTSMDADTLLGYATGSDTSQVIEGMKASLSSADGSKLTTADDSVVYVDTGLKEGSSTFTSAYVNKNLISSFTVRDASSYTFTNGSGTWTKTYSIADVINATGSKVMLNGGDSGDNLASANTKPIVVGGAGALHLEAWGKGDVNLDDDLYIGSSTYNGGVYDNADKFGVVRISNDDELYDYGANLSGNIYLVEDSSIKGTGTRSINISGTITDKNVPTDDASVDGNYTLTIGGAGFELSGKVAVSGLSLVQGYDSNFNSFQGTALISSTAATVDELTVGENTKLTVTGNLTLGCAVNNAGTMDWSEGTIVFNNLNGEGYEASPIEFYNSTGNDKSTSSNGYAYNGKVLLANGTVTTGENTSISGEGLTSWEYVDGKGLIGTLEGSAFDTSCFYVESGTVRLSKSAASSDGVIYADNTASTYVVRNGATLDVYFNTNDFSSDYALVGKTIRLEGGSTLTNTGGNGNESWQQLKNIELSGDATLNATNGNSYGFLASGYGASNLDLNGYTLEKTGDGTFILLNTTVSAGTIKITEGSIKVRHTSSNASAADFVLNGDSTSLIVESGKTLSVKSLSGNGTITGGGVVDVTAAYANCAGNDNKLNNLLDSLKSIKTTSESYILATGSSSADYTKDSGNMNLQRNAEINCDIVFTNNLGLNGKAWSTQTPYSLLINEGGSMKIGASGTGVLSLVTGATLNISGGSVTAGAVVLGHNSGVVSTDTGKSQNPHLYHGIINMSGSESSLTVDKITFNGSSANAVTVTGGEVEFTNTGNIATSIIAAADTDDVGTVSFSNTKLIANNSWALASDSENVKMDLSGVTFNVAEGKSISLDGTQVKVAGNNTVEGAGKLAFTGDVSSHLKDADTSVAVKSGAELTWNADSVSVKALSENTDATVSAAAINAAKVNVNTATTTEVQAITGSSELTVSGANQLTVSGDADISKLQMNDGATVAVTGNANVSTSINFAAEGALSVTGALTLGDDVTVDLTGLTINDNKTSYTLATATGGITGSISVENIQGLDLSNTAFADYSYSISVGDANAAAGVMTLADGTSANTALILTLTAPSDTPEPTLTATVTGGSYDAASNVLTLTTDVNDATAVVFGDKFNAVMSDEVWDAIVGASSTMQDQIAVSFADANGTLLDFGDNGTLTTTTITINGVGTVGEQTLSGKDAAAGTIVGNYVTAYIPEPTTTTLSLLALAGLAVRRRRR